MSRSLQAFLFSALSLALLPCLFSGCLASLDAPDTHPARITVEMEVNSPEVLGKGGSVVLSRILVRLVSTSKDTLYDTITSQGSRLSRDPDTFLATRTSSQVVSALYDLAPNRNWTIRARLMDTRDSTRQVDSIRVPKVAAFEYRTVAMCLHPRVTAFSAHFFLPSEIRVLEAGAVEASRKIYFTRLNLMEGDEVKCDSSALGTGSGEYLSADPALLPGSEHRVFFRSGSFGETPSVLLTDEYAKVGVRFFTLNAYGYIEGDTVGVTPLRLLFQGTQSVNTELAKETGAVAMEWKASDVAVAKQSAESEGSFTVLIGKSGTIVVNVRLSGELDL